ncbi:hypothetical protein SAMN05446935_7549 [Burkholderia sp. YR290]|nr:hypothetical protein SAMN05446935_7549 [Burkholderia sp. YR290]
MSNFEQGKMYEFTLSDGRILKLRFDGLGEWMRPKWFEPATGATIDPLPAYKSVKHI